MSKSHIQAYLTESLGCQWANGNIILANLSDIQAKWEWYSVQPEWYSG